MRLDQLGFSMENELSIDLILVSLLNSFAHFVLNSRMNDKETSLPELINLLKTIEPTFKNEGKVVLLVDSFDSKKSSKNKKKRKITKQKGGVAKKKAKETSSKGTCFHCGKKRPFEKKLQGLHEVEEEGGI